MRKQTNFLGYLIFKAIAVVVVSIALIFVYQEVSKYNFETSIFIQNYQVHTYLGFILFVILVIIGLLFFINGLINGLINRLLDFRDSLRGSRVKKAVSSMLEAAILLSFGDKKASLTHIESIDDDYLTNDQKDYLKLMSIIASSKTIPVTLYGSIQKFPFIKNQLSKKLAEVEYKLGNYPKALEYARNYYSVASKDYEISVLLANIYFEYEDYKAIDNIASTMNWSLIPSGIREELSGLYYKVAKIHLSESKNIDVLAFCKKSVELNPKNIEAAELFAEVGASQKNYDIVNELLMKSFCTSPNFHMFMLLKQFTNKTYNELFEELKNSCNYKEYLDLFIAISVLLDLPEKRTELIDQAL